MQSNNSSSNGITKLQSRKSVRPTWKTRVTKIWTASGLNTVNLLNMFKFTLGPTIAVAMFQHDQVSQYYGTTGYIVAVAALLSNALAPRAAFLESMLVNILSVCATAAVVLLAVWSAFKAREHTTPAGQPLGGYNSSASTVCGVWMFFLVYVINAFKSARPQYKFAGVMSTIFAVVGTIYGAQFTELSGSNNSAFGFVQRFLTTLLTGMAIATATSLLINPTNCRTPVLKGLRSYFLGIDAVLMAQMEYFRTLETESPFDDSEEADTLRIKTTALRSINTKLYTDIRSSKKEIAYGKLEADDFVEIHRLGREILLPIVGSSSVVDIFDRLARNAGWRKTDPDPQSKAFPDAPYLDKEQVEKEYHCIMRSIREPVGDISLALSEAVQHILLTLGLEKKHRLSLVPQATDRENKAGVVAPGDPGFADYLESRVQRFRDSRRKTLYEFCEMHGIPLAADSFDTDWEWPVGKADIEAHHRQRQLFILLHIEHLLWSAGHAFVELVRYCDSQTLEHHLIVPSWRRIRKWLFNIGRFADPGDDDDGLAEMSDIMYGEAFRCRRDPERLPAKTSWQRFGASFRNIPTLLRCSHSIFGFRVACAIMTVAIAAFLRDTQAFFVRQRLFWAAIMAAVSMTRTAGLATWIYFLRFGGSALAAVCCYIIWYIVNGHTAGVLVFMGLFIMAYGWLVVVQPRFLLAGMIAGVTTVICVGYELQVIELGVELATSNGQDYYPIFLLAPIRLATVAAGLLVAYIFTVFPFPVTERSELRKDVGTSLLLAAHHYAVIQETINARARGDDGDMNDKASPGRRLQKERMRILARIMVLVERMRGESAMTRWQLPIDGYFPREAYDKIITLVDKIVMYAALKGHASISFSLTEPNCVEHHHWFDSLKRLLAGPEMQIPSQGVTTTLFLLSSSMVNAQPLPPHPPLPQAFDLLRYLQDLDPHILSLRHVAEPGYSGFAVMQIASRSLIADLHSLTGLVRGLVGELDFSYQYKGKGNKAA